MLKFTPFLLIILYATAMWFFSYWRLKAELNAKSSPLTHPRLVPMLERLGKAMDLPPVRAHVYEIAPVNGLAAPDGRIFLTRGFLDRLDKGEVTEAELASVIAHELGHVASGHTRRRLVDFAGQNVVRMVLAGVLGRFIPGIGAWIANLVASAVAARLSRQDEFEADQASAHGAGGAHVVGVDTAGTDVAPAGPPEDAHTHSDSDSDSDSLADGHSDPDAHTHTHTHRDALADADAPCTDEPLADIALRRTAGGLGRLPGSRHRDRRRADR